MLPIFRDKLKEFLNHECDDCGLVVAGFYDDENDDIEFEVEIKRCAPHEFGVNILFRWNDSELQIEVDEDEEIFENISAYDNSVKYFWMKLPMIFSER